MQHIHLPDSPLTQWDCWTAVQCRFTVHWLAATSRHERFAPTALSVCVVDTVVDGLQAMTQCRDLGSVVILGECGAVLGNWI